MPRSSGSEDSCKRIKVMAICYGYTKTCLPQSSRLVSWSMQMFQAYVDFLFCPEIWGFES